MKRSRWKDLLAACSIIILLPYVVTVLVSGFAKPDDEKTVKSGEKITLEENGTTRELDREQYLIEVLAAQVPITYEKEAMKAQAVIARTFFTKYQLAGTTVKKEETKQEYMSTTQMEELWGDDFKINYQKLEQAVEETKNEKMTYQGTVIEPSFHAVSGGLTRNADEVFGKDVYPYLKSKESQKDKEASEYVTMLQFSNKELEDIVRQNYGEEAVSSVAASPAGAFVIQERDSANYVTKLQVAGQSVGGEKFRDQFDLPSADFEIESYDNSIRIICQGLGHGFGLSLYGANVMAKEGKNYKEILQYYFENIEISSE